MDLNKKIKCLDQGLAHSRCYLSISCYHYCDYCYHYLAFWASISLSHSLVCRSLLLKKQNRASLVAQWLRIRLPMQGTRVRALVWEDPTCHGATRPVSHNY